MPRYQVRLESTDHFAEDGTPHYRLTTLAAESPEAAREYCVEHEFKFVGFRLTPERLADLQAVLDAHNGDLKALNGQDRGHYAIHQQTTPYHVVNVTELPARAG